MEIRSKRDKLVGKLVIFSITIASIFGVNIFYFNYSQNKLKSSIKKIEALNALETSLATDKIGLISNLKKEELICSDNFPNKCSNYFTALIMTRNRLKDYKITFSETLEIPKDNSLYEKLDQVIDNTNIVAESSFKLSFEEAKDLKIATANEYITYIKKLNTSKLNLNSTNKILLLSTAELYTQINNWQDNTLKNMKPIDQLKRDLNLTFYILAFLEILLFLLVAIIDLINNNVDGKETSFINIKIKLTQKVKPLFISFLFIFFGIMSGQKLLSYENENIVLLHCRQLNLHNIFSYNNLVNIPFEKRPEVLNLLNISQYCYKYISNETKEQLVILDQYPLKEYEVLYEVIGYKIRLYADSFNKIENSRNAVQGNLLLALLALNVASLGSQAIFLKQDSADIDQSS